MDIILKCDIKLAVFNINILIIKNTELKFLQKTCTVFLVINVLMNFWKSFFDELNLENLKSYFTLSFHNKLDKIILCEISFTTLWTLIFLIFSDFLRNEKLYPITIGNSKLFSCSSIRGVMIETQNILILRVFYFSLMWFWNQKIQYEIINIM